MDGASKFARGNAIAGLLVVLINVIGGMVIGIVQQASPSPRPPTPYTLLTVGDGLVTQVPALIVSTAARRRACWRNRKSIRAPAQDRGQHLRHSRGRVGAPLNPMAAIRFPDNGLWLVPARHREPRRNKDATHLLSRLFKVR
jgi:hypothetical protein